MSRTCSTDCRAIGCGGPIGAIVVGLGGLVDAHVLGAGYASIEAILSGSWPSEVITALLVVKGGRMAGRAGSERLAALANGFVVSRNSAVLRVD